MLYKKNRLTDIIFIFFILLLVMLVRRYDAFANPQFFTEDSTIFFQGFLDRGWGSVFQPYNGYLHLLPRLIACTSGVLCTNYKYMPLWYNMLSFAVTFFVCVSLYLSAIKLDLKHKVLYATFFLFLPIGGELFMNATHIIWIISIYMINFLYVDYYPDRAGEDGRWGWQQYLKLLVLFVFSLSGTCSLLVAPAIALILFLERKKLSVKKVIPLCVILLCGICQYLSIRFVSVRKPGEWTIGTLCHYLVNLFTGNTIDVFFLYLLNPVLRYKLQFILSCLVLMMLTYFFVKSYIKVANPRKYVIVLAGAAFFASAIAIQGKDSNPVILGFTVLHNDPVKWASFDGWFTYQRYLFIPYACIAWIFILALDKVLKVWHMGVYLIFIVFHYRALKNNLPDLHWKEQVSEYYEGKKDTILTNPSMWGFKVILPKKAGSK